MAFRDVKRHLPKVLSIFTLCCLCFAYGLAAAQYEVFPYGLLRDARTAFLALVEVSRPAPPAPSIDPRRTASRQFDMAPVAERFSPAAGEELLLVSGGPGYLKEHCESGCLAWLVNREGAVQHVWKYDPALWSDLKSVSRVPLVSGAIYPVGLHVFDDGGLLAVFQGENTFPFAIGLARFDVNSRLLWKKEVFAHHWLSVADDGRIYVPAMQVVDAPVRIGKTAAQIQSDTGKIYSDTVLILDAEGQVLDEIPLLEALFASGWAGLLTRAGGAKAVDIVAPDPLHLNDVQLAGAGHARFQPWLAPGDLLLSFASINAVGVLDPQTRRFKWMSAGTTVGQHSPRFYDGGVLVLDNLGGDDSLGGTQLVKIGLARGEPTVMFPRPGVVMPAACRTETSGHLDLSRDGRRVLMALANAGTVWEIDLHSGEVLWEYRYVHSDQPGSGAKIHTAKYVQSLSFLQKRNRS